MNSSNIPQNTNNIDASDQNYVHDNLLMSRNHPISAASLYDGSSSSSHNRVHIPPTPLPTSYVDMQMQRNIPSSSMGEVPMPMAGLNPMLYHYLPISMPTAIPYAQHPFQTPSGPLYYNPYHSLNIYAQRDVVEESHGDVLGALKRKADQDDHIDEDDDDEDDDAPGAIGDETKSTGSKISNIRENSKYQREKRKAFVKNLESLAKKLSESSDTIYQKLNEDFETLNIVHQTLKQQAIAFVCLLFNVESKDSTSDMKKSWPDVLENPAFGGFEIHVPPLSFAYKPPLQLDPHTAMLRLTNASDVLSFTVGLQIAFESIARTGTNICDSLRFRLKIGKKSIVVDKNLVSFSVIIESYNAKILGGVTDITWKGTVPYCQCVNFCMTFL